MKFEDSLQKDIERRLRAAITKLRNWSIDAHVEEVRTDQWGKCGSSELGHHAEQLEHALAWFLARGNLSLDEASRTALRYAESSRRPKFVEAEEVPPPAPSRESSTSSKKRRAPAVALAGAKTLLLPMRTSSEDADR